MHVCARVCMQEFPDTWGGCESAAGALYPALCHNIIGDLGELDGVQRGAAPTIKGLEGLRD